LAAWLYDLEAPSLSAEVSDDVKTLDGTSGNDDDADDAADGPGPAGRLGSESEAIYADIAPSPRSRARRNAAWSYLGLDATKARARSAASCCADRACSRRLSRVAASSSYAAFEFESCEVVSISCCACCATRSAIWIVDGVSTGAADNLTFIAMGLHVRMAVSSM